MSTLSVCLFGKLRIRRDGRVMGEFACGKPQELLCYLLLHRAAPLPRESLATLLWGDNSTAQSGQYLRQSLWKLQTRLNSQPDPSHILLIDHDSVRFNPQADLWLDVAAFEQAFAPVHGVPGQQLGEPEAQALQTAVELYQGDLLEGWYQDWCLCERERLRNLYLAMLHKLMGYCEARGQYEQGVSYGETILRYDHAQERAHRAMMRLRYQSGDRTSALRQYAHCTAALQEEFGVAPGKLTTTLYQQIQTDNVECLTPVLLPIPSAPGAAAANLPEILTLLKRLQVLLPNLERQVQCDVQLNAHRLNGESRVASDQAVRQSEKIVSRDKKTLK